MTLIQYQPVPPETLTPERCQEARRASVWGQCAGAIGTLVFTNGLLLLYLKSLGMGPVGIMLSLAVQDAARGLLTIPAAYLCDFHGIKRVAYVGLAGTVVGYAAIAVGGFGQEWVGQATVVAGMVIYAVGSAVFSSGWFALLAGVVPVEMRGRYFGLMRFAWQVVVIVFTGITSLWLKEDSPTVLFQIVMAVILLGQIDRLWNYRLIPEAATPVPPRSGMISALMEVVRSPGYMGFCAYLFLLHLFTAGTVVLFGLVQKKELNLADRTVVLLGMSMMLGYLIGFGIGGRIVDKVGSKVVFLICHMGYGLVLLSFPFRAAVGAVIPMLAATSFGYGVIYAASTVAISTEMLALAPQERKSLSTGLCNTLVAGGSALSNVLAAMLINSGMLRDQWTLAGTDVSRYDGVILMYGVMVVLLVVALGLVPSVVRKAELVPKGV